MSISKSIYAGIGSAILVSAFSAPVFAGPSEALAACKTEIASDSRFSQYAAVLQSTDEIKRRGRFTKFEIKVNARAEDGASASWVANCKARNSGLVETLELVQVAGDSDQRVAKTGN
ncbi:MAG: hypothetical protein ABJ308_14000 [Halieaceae bacterium]